MQIHVIVNVQRVIQIKNTIMINVHVSVKGIVLVNKIIVKIIAHIF